MIDIKTRAVAHFFPDARTVHSIYKLLFKAEFEDTKEVIRIRILKKNRQHNGQKKKDKQRSIKHTHKRADKIYIAFYCTFSLASTPGLHTKPRNPKQCKFEPI